MNVKNDSKSLNELCVVCLCVGRSLRVITEDKILKYYLDALQEIPLNRVSSVLLVCWECEVLLKRAVQFRQQVQDSHRILQTYTKENLNEYLLTEVSRPPRLKITKNEIIAISPHVDCSRRPNVRVDFKDEVKNEVIQNFIGSVEREQEDALVNVRSVSKRKSKQWTRKKLKRNREKFSECFLNEVSYATSGTRNRKDLQSVLVKDEVKNEKSGSDIRMSDECVIDADFSDDSTEEIGLKDNKNGDKFSGSEGDIETAFEDDKFTECFLNEVSYATSSTRNRKDLQSVFVKDEVKNENSDSDIQMSDDCVMDPDFSDDSGEEMGLKEKKSSDKFRGSRGDNETAFKNNKIQNMSDTGGIPLNVNIEDNATLDLQFDCLKVEIDNGRSRDEAGSGIDPGTAVHDHPSAKVPGTLKRKTKRCPAKKTKKAKGVKGNGVNKKVKGSEDKLYTTIELTHEQMLDERNAAHGSESFQSSAYKCETCILGFQYRRPYEAHLSSRHAKTLGDYVCPICKTVVMSVDSFTAHYRRHMRRFQCNLCEKRTIDRGRIKQHLYTEHGVVMSTIKCKQCGHVSRSLDNHIHHLDTHKGRFKCKECTKTFKHRGGLKNHAIAVHELKNNFPCSVCQKVFRWKNSLKRHTEVHLAKDTTEAAYCESCGIGFKSVCSFQRHMKNSLKHVTHDQRKYVCDHCNRRFIDKTKLRDHIECKHMHKTYQCHICLKPSKNRVNLDQHIRNVHKGRPNNKICHHCGKGFPTKVQLDSHMRTHTGERPFICEYCPTTFTQKSNLYKHYKQVHLNIKSKRYPPVKKPKDALNCQPSIGGFERINGTTYPPERGLVPC